MAAIDLLSYTRNIISVYPAWAACILFTAIGIGSLGIRYLKERNLHPDYQEAKHESYKVRRIEDVDNTDRDCYN